MMAVSNLEKLLEKIGAVPKVGVELPRVYNPAPVVVPALQAVQVYSGMKLLPTYSDYLDFYDDSWTDYEDYWWNNYVD